MLKRFIRIVGGDPNKREIERMSETVEQINALEQQFENYSDEELLAKTDEFRSFIADKRVGVDTEEELKQGEREALVEREALEEILPEAFAAVREASKRTIGLRHYDVQLIGGMVLHQGKIAEMRTGEGKTLVATLPLYLNALAGKGAHLITVNDYLARRDARWMAPIYNLLGLSVGVLQMAARTENGKKAFLVDLSKESPHEDQDRLRMVPRIEAYLADITYGTNSEFGFDYLRDNMTMSLADRVQRGSQGSSQGGPHGGHYYAIIDEVDNVLIDEARTPLIISGPAQDEAEWYIRISQVAKALKPEDYEVDEKDRTVTLTELGEAHVEELLNMPLRDPERPEDVTPEQERIIGYLEQALRAQFLYRRNKDYLVQAGKVIIIDEFTGRMMPGRRWSDGLHQAVEAKEGVKVQSESVTYATITIQNYFRMYQKLAGMSGTALTESEEFDKIYTLGVLAIPTNLEYQAMKPGSELVELEAKDEQGYKFQYYTRHDDPLKEPIFWRRKDYPDVVYRSVEAKLRAISREILMNHVLGRPMLVGTTSVENSERLSTRLRAEPLRRLSQTLLLRDAWTTQNDYQEDGRQIPALQFLNQSLEELDLNQMRKLARDLNVPFLAEDPANLERLASILDLPPQSQERLFADLQAGIPHQVLNARKHTEESQIIAAAGSFGAVTIATNMAGRGVDIKLGGELAEEIIAIVNRVLSRAGYEKAYEMTDLERKEALLRLDPSEYGIYDAEIGFFMKHLDEMEQVRSLGGLHVIGSERHEARRIDNQLRGRSARQGDPGSSRFFLSMEDDLMRLFGGQQADSMMQRLKIDDALPLEMGLVSRLIEQSQTRVEGANFDVRKHLLEYDDVLNAQRARIYSERNRVFTKTDLTEDVTTMLRTELIRRVPEALKDEAGPWKLLAWLEQVQPSISLRGALFPSYSFKLLVAEIQKRLPESPAAVELREVLLEVASGSLQAETGHHLQAIEAMLEASLDRMEVQIRERLDALDTFFEGLSLAEEEGEARKPAELLAELSNAARLPLKLSSDQQRALRTEPETLAAEVREQVSATIQIQTVGRLLGTIEMRIGESLELQPAQLDPGHWGSMTGDILAAVQQALLKRQERLVGEGGQITKDLDNLLTQLSPPYSDHEIIWLLMQIPHGTRATFDRRTHRRMVQRTNRLTYVFYAARFLEDLRPDQIADEVLEHLENAQQVIWRAWGQAEFSRLGDATLADLEETTRQEISELLDLPPDSAVLNLTLNSLDPEQQSLLKDELGRRVISNIYRQLLLGVITELWVDYLTQMEGLRVSIGLEAYAQRDPLVQYKSKASELFSTLQSNIRLGVISRMFTYQPRDLSRVQTNLMQSDRADESAEFASALTGDEELAPELESVSGSAAGLEGRAQSNETKSDSPKAGTSGKKRRRRRR
jgi:preprotein translocase subunit SecA